MKSELTKYISAKHILDMIVIVLNMTYRLSILGCFTIDLFPGDFPYLKLIVPLLAVYLLRFGAKFSFTAQIFKRHRYLSFWLIFFIFEAFQAIIISGTIGFFLNILYYLLMWEYLYGIYKENSTLNGYDKICVPLECYTVYNCVVVLIAAVLIFSGVLNAFDNPVSDVFNVFKENHEHNHTDYYFPGYLSVCVPATNILAFLGIPILEGLSYEPHVLSYSIIPAWILLQASIKDKTHIYKFISYFLLLSTVCISTSATAVICLIITIFFEILWYCLRKGDFRPLIVLFVFILLITLFLAPIYEELSEYLAYKIGKEDGSRDYSESNLNYILYASDVLGRGIVNNHAGSELLNDNIGYISSLFIILLYIITVFKSIKLIVSSDVNLHYIGLACLYFWLHSLKLGIQAFSYPYFIFFIFIMAISKRLKCSQLRTSNS